MEKKPSKSQTPTDRIRSLWNDGRKPTADVVKAAIIGEMIGLVKRVQDKAYMQSRTNENKERQVETRR